MRRIFTGLHSAHSWWKGPQSHLAPACSRCRALACSVRSHATFSIAAEPGTPLSILRHAQAAWAAPPPPPPPDLHQEGDLRSAAGQRRWLSDALYASTVARAGLCVNAWSLLPARAAAGTTAAAPRPRSRSHGRAHPVWGLQAASTVRALAPLREVGRAVETDPEGESDLEDRFRILAHQVLQHQASLQLKELAAVASPALVAAMQDEVAALREQGLYISNFSTVMHRPRLVARALWPAAALAPWHRWDADGGGGGDGEAPPPPPRLDSLGKGLGPLWEVVVVNIPGKWWGSFPSTNGLVVTEVESYVPAAPPVHARGRVLVSHGSSHARVVHPGDWLFYRGPLPEERADGRLLQLPWRVLRWG